MLRMGVNQAKEIGPDFYKFKGIPPAFAGTIVDWSMGSREITATIIDLVTRDYIFVQNNVIIRNKKNKPLRKFENKFLNTIFSKRESLTFDQFSNIAFKTEFNNLLKIFADGMIEEGFVDKNFQDKLVDAVKQSITEITGINKRERNIRNVNSSDNNEVKVIKSWVLKAFLIVVGILWVVSCFSHYLNFISPLLFIILVFSLVVHILVKSFSNRIAKKLGESYDWMLTTKGRSARSDCLDLKKYMETYPLIEDRLANELVSFAISFGIGKSWMKKVGKFNANLNLFLERISSPEDTMILFLDFSKYLASIETKR